MRSALLFLILVGHKSHGYVVHRYNHPAASYISASVPIPDNLDVSYRRIPRRKANNPSLSGVSVTEAMDSMSSTSGPHVKKWADPFGVTVANPELETDAIKVICYNCLGPMHGEGSKHDYAAVSITKWTRRRDRLLEELRGMSADIYCLQEISAKALKETFIPNLKHVGLECFGFAPSKQADKVKGKYGHKHVGCAIFGRVDKFNIIASKRVHLRDYGPLKVCRSHRFHVDFVGKWNSMVMLMVQLKTTNQTVCIANTHIFWNPARADIKATQTYAALDAINKFCLEVGFPKGQQPPLVLCGDFNTVPDLGYDSTGTWPSGPFQLLEHGILTTDHPQHPDTFYSKVECTPGRQGHDTTENPRLGEFNSGWKLRNAYSLPEFTGQQPLFTTKTDEFQGWIDHIWVSDAVKVDMVLSPPIRSGDLEASLKARQFSPIPNKNYPSDHLPIGIVAKVFKAIYPLLSHFTDDNVTGLSNGFVPTLPATPLGEAQKIAQAFQETWKAARDQAKNEGGEEEREDVEENSHGNEEDEVDEDVEDEVDDRSNSGSIGGESGQGFKRPDKGEIMKNKNKNK